MKKNEKNLLFALAVLAAAGGLWLAARTARPARRARVEIVGADPVYLDLDRDGVYPIEGAALPVTLEVKDGAVRFVDSRSPDHLCEGFGCVKNEYDRAVCMPAGVAVSAEAG